MGTTIARNSTSSGGSCARHIAFPLLLAISVALYWKALGALVSVCLHGDSYSHILLIPLITIYLLVTERARIFRESRTAIPAAVAIAFAGLLITFLANSRFYLSGGEHLSATILGLVFVWVGVFVGCFGTGAARSAAFPLGFLILMVPLPDAVLSPIVAALQRGSVEVSFLLFKLCGVPVLREGFTLAVPGVTIEVAKECSSIRSSMALVITCILAARFCLRTFWRQVLFVVISLPLSVVKNGIRIVTLTLLSVYVNPGFLHGDLHRDGGFVFFLLALLMLWPVLSFLSRSESRGRTRSAGIGSSRELAHE